MTSGNVWAKVKRPIWADVESYKVWISPHWIWASFVAGLHRRAPTLILKAYIPSKCVPGVGVVDSRETEIHCSNDVTRWESPTHRGVRARDEVWWDWVDRCWFWKAWHQIRKACLVYPSMTGLYMKDATDDSCAVGPYCPSTVGLWFSWKPPSDTRVSLTCDYVTLVGQAKLQSAIIFYRRRIWPLNAKVCRPGQLFFTLMIGVDAVIAIEFIVQFRVMFSWTNRGWPLFGPIMVGPVWSDQPWLAHCLVSATQA